MNLLGSAKPSSGDRHQATTSSRNSDWSPRTKLGVIGSYSLLKPIDSSTNTIPGFSFRAILEDPGLELHPVQPRTRKTCGTADTRDSSKTLLWPDSTLPEGRADRSRVRRPTLPRVCFPSENPIRAAVRRSTTIPSRHLIGRDSNENRSTRLRRVSTSPTEAGSSP